MVIELVEIGVGGEVLLRFKVQSSIGLQLGNRFVFLSG
jgi:hypothetical protein